MKKNLESEIQKLRTEMEGAELIEFREEKETKSNQK